MGIEQDLGISMRLLSKKKFKEFIKKKEQDENPADALAELRLELEKVKKENRQLKVKHEDVMYKIGLLRSQVKRLKNKLGDGNK